MVKWLGERILDAYYVNNSLKQIFLFYSLFKSIQKNRVEYLQPIFFMLFRDFHRVFVQLNLARFAQHRRNMLLRNIHQGVVLGNKDLADI